jgi:DNA-binding transcriptional regulator YdaS (Cro superfamily)
MTALEKIRSVRGQAAEIARAIDRTEAAVSLWTRIPADHVLTVERITGIPRTELRPDLYPPERRKS